MSQLRWTVTVVFALGLVVSPVRAADHPQVAVKLILKENATTGKSKLTWVSKSPPIVLPAADPASVGATLEVSSANAESDVFPLPAGSGWTTNGAGTLLKFVNKAAPGGPSPVKVTVIKQGTTLKVAAKSSGLSLDEPTQGTVSVRLQIGADVYCSTCTAPLRDEPGKFIARGCGAPAGCGSVVTTTSTSTSSTPPTTNTTTTIPGCCGPSRDVLAFTTLAGSGNCGTVQNTSGTVVLTLACGGLYFGGGDDTVPLPAITPDYESFLSNVTACNGTTGALTLAARTAAQTGSIRTCTAAGCLYGAPLPIPNSNSTPTSTCVINSVATDLVGSANCATGAVLMDLPLSSEIYLTGDTLAADAGIQPCPTCTSRPIAGSCTTGLCCKGGSNDNQNCIPASTNLGSAGPTSHDCPPDPLLSIGAVPIPYVLTTGTAQSTAANLPFQLRFCGFCYDGNAGGTLGVNGFGKCVGAPFAGAVCRSTSECAPGVCAGPVPCTSDADCTEADPESRENCLQGSPGAFTKGSANTITETGTAAGNLTDGLAHPATVVSVFCIPPTFNGTVDAAADLPGPGAVSLAGTAALQ